LVFLVSHESFENGGSQSPKKLVARADGQRALSAPVAVWPAEFIATLGAWEEDIPRPDVELLGKLKLR